MRGAANQAALQQADEQLMANRRLRELYERGNPSIQELGAISPEYAQKVQQFNNEQLMQQMKMMEMQQNMQKTQNEETEKKQHIFGNVLGVYTEDWLEKHPNPTPQELDQYKHGLGEQLSFIERAYGYKPDMPLDVHHPEKILTTAEGVMKYNSRRQKTAQEAQLRGLPPQMSSEQFYGAGPKVERNPVTGRPELIPGAPGLRGGRQQIPSGSIFDQSTGEQIAPTPENLPKLQKLYDEVSDPNEKNILGSVINGIKMSGALPMAGTTDIATEKGRIAGAEEKAREETKAEVQRTEEGKRITDSFKRAMGEGGVSRVMKLIAESTSGKGEELAAKARGTIPGVGASPGMENIGALNTIAGELRKTIERSPGAQSDKDVALAALDAAAIADPSIPYNQRMKGFLEFTRIIKERAKDLHIDPKVLGIDVDTETGKKLTEGHKEDGYTFKGGDPSDPKNWEKD